ELRRVEAGSNLHVGAHERRENLPPVRAPDQPAGLQPGTAELLPRLPALGLSAVSRVCRHWRDCGPILIPPLPATAGLIRPLRGPVLKRALRLLRPVARSRPGQVPGDTLEQPLRGDRDLVDRHLERGLLAGPRLGEAAHLAGAPSTPPDRPVPHALRPPAPSSPRSARTQAPPPSPSCPAIAIPCRGRARGGSAAGPRAEQGRSPS